MYLGIVNGLIVFQNSLKKKCTYSRFQDALVEYGVDKEEIFQTNDLTERKDIANVTNTLYALGRAVSIII